MDRTKIAGILAIRERSANDLIFAAMELSQSHSLTPLPEGRGVFYGG